MKTKILIVLLLAGFFLFFYKVGDRDLWAPDEDEYAQMSREMIRFNNWAFPTVNGQPWAIKPVLYNWLIALVSLPWGDVNEFRARVFSSLAALGTFLATYYLGRRAFSPLAGILSAAVLGTSVLFLQYARWSQTNMLSTFFMTFAVVMFYRGYTDPAKRTLCYLLIPKMEFYKSPRPFCEEIVANLDKGGQWAMYRFYRAAYVYYTDSFCTVLDSESELEAFLKQPQMSMVVLKEKHYETLSDSIKKKTYLLIKNQIGHRSRVLIANQKPS